MELNIDQILSAQEESVAEVSVPEWGGSVFVRRLSALESLEMFMELRDKSNGSELQLAQARLVRALASYLCDSSGKSIANLEQARVIAGKSATAVNRIVDQAQKLNAVGNDSLDVLAKNSAPSPAATSPSV